MWIVSIYIDPLIHKYLVTVFNMRTDDIHLCSLAYNFDVFLSCSNPSQVHDAGLLQKHATISTIPTPLVLYHTPIRFYLLISSNNHALVPSSFPCIIFSPEDIIWLSFNSVTRSFVPQLESFPDGIVTHYILYFISSYFYHS